MAAHQAPVPGILQARTLEWVAISFSSAWKWKLKVKLLSHVWLLATPQTAAHQAPPSMGFSRQEYWSGVPLPSPELSLAYSKGCKNVIYYISNNLPSYELPPGKAFTLCHRYGNISCLSFTQQLFLLSMCQAVPCALEISKKRECPCPSRNFLSLVALEFNIKLNKHHMTSVLNKYKVKLSQYHVTVV